MTPVEINGYSIIFAPVCSNCRQIITDPVYIEQTTKTLAAISEKDRLNTYYEYIHPAMCRNCGVRFDHIIGPGNQYHPYDIDEVFRLYGQEESGNV